MAKLFAVDLMTIGNGGENAYAPAKRFLPRIVDWLGYETRSN